MLWPPCRQFSNVKTIRALSDGALLPQSSVALMVGGHPWFRRIAETLWQSYGSALLRRKNQK
jgi:hypothetical protein